MAISSTLHDIFRRNGLPDRDSYAETLNRTIDTLRTEAPGLRPPDSQGLPGGLVQLDPALPTLIIPDLHARMDFFVSIFEYPVVDGLSVTQALDAGSIQLLCLGDGFHAEKRAYDRWQAALKEFVGGFKKHKAMDEEMRESLGLMEMVMQAKLAWPDRFHFLKGNHENILNENADGNFAFRKFAFEGDMVRDWVARFWGEDFLYRYADFEKSLPLFVIGGRFLASHAEPACFHDRQEIINYRGDPELVSDLIWTDNDAAEAGSVERMLASYLPDCSDAVYFGGHRTISGRYRLRAGGRFVQIHNPDRFNAAWAMADRPFDPECDIGEVADISASLLQPADPQHS